MKRIRSSIALCISLLASITGFSQITTLVCNDLVFIPLDANCTHTISAESILEGGPYYPYDHYIVEIDKVPPYGNGPWVPAVITTADIGKTYQARVTDPFTGNKCWGNVKLGTHLDCPGFVNVDLEAGGTADLTPGEVQIPVSDICVPSNTMTITKVDGQNSVLLDCTDLGAQTIKLTASDQIGNTSECEVPLVVTDPLGACGDCVLCPPTQTVSFEQAVTVLLPAVQAGDFAPFEQYGDATYNSACAIVDSTNWVIYQPTSLEHSWFTRTWKVFDVAGQVLGSCNQTILFEFNQAITVNGLVYADTVENCLRDVAEPGLNILKVHAIKLPSNEKTIVTPNADGSYSFALQARGIDSLIEVRIELPAGVSSPCPTVLAINPASMDQQYTMDFGVRTSTFCPDLEVSLHTPFLRRCAPNTYFVKYCNNGLATAENAYVTVELDSLLAVNYTSIPWSNQVGNTFTFPVGDIPPLTCNTFTIRADLSCNTILGQTLCNEAQIFPNTFCNGSWDGPHVEAKATCEGDSVALTILNSGTKDMTEALNFIVIEDVIMYREGTFQLDAGEFMTLKMLANGATWRIEAQQVPGNPINDAPSATVETCGGLNTPGLVNAFPSNDEPAFVDISCDEVIGSYDPNDKAATPTGYGADHIIRKNTDIEYKIRFQNTGTDTAFRVIIVDTLSALLDHASIEAGVSSHPYRLDVYPGGILHFVFNPIILPDSNVNEVASHGFVSFRIAQQPDLPDGTEIHNSAGIYFDFNDPVITNTVSHTIGEPFIVLETNDAAVPGVRLELSPNPLHDNSVLRLHGTSLEQGLFRLYDQHGRELQTQTFQGNQCTIERRNLRSGLYFFQVSDRGAPVASGKVQVY